MATIRLEVIKPGKQPTAQDFVTAMKKAALKTANLTQRDLEATTRTWDHKVKFVVVVEENASAYAIFAGTNDDIYNYVDRGTKAHDIFPKRSKYLRFYGGYRAKTRVGIIGSQEGGASGEAVFRQSVHHPGFAGRNFAATIARRRQKTLEQEMSQSIAKVARAQG